MELIVSQTTADEWRVWRELRLEALREAPYAFGSTLAEWQGGADTEGRWRRRLTDVPFNLIARLADTPAGIASGTAPTPDGAVELISMWVAPFARGRGVGDALVCRVVQWACEQHAKQVTLAVVANNTNAIALYKRHGFCEAGMIDGEIAMLLHLQSLRT